MFHFDDEVMNPKPIPANDTKRRLWDPYLKQANFWRISNFLVN